MDNVGLEKVTEVVASTAETFGSKHRVTGLPEQGPPYNGVSIQIEASSVRDVAKKQIELRKALGEAGLLYDKSEGDSPTNSPALRTWEVGVSSLEFVDMSTEHGQRMDAMYGTR